MKQFFTFLLVLLTVSLYSDRPPPFAITESLPASLVAGSVNVITGDHYFTEEDIVIQGAFPLKIPRTYISSSKKWQDFPHLCAYFETEYYERSESEDHDSALWLIQITESNGTVLSFEANPTALRKKKQPIMFYLQASRFNQGLTNAAKGEISGKTNLKNVRIEMESKKESFLFYGSDGTVRYYQKVKAGTYLLQWEKMPNQSLICYGHDKYHRLNIIRVANSNNTKTFASAKIVYHSEKPGKNNNYDIHTSDGRVLNYRFETLSDFPLLVNVSTPAYPQEFISYHKVKYGSGTWGYLLGHRDISCHRHYNVDYYWQGHHHVHGQDIKIKIDNPKWLRVKTLSSPVGNDATPHITHTFTYNTDSRITYVREIDQTLTEYRYSPHFRLEHILYYGQGDQIHHSEKYVWGEEGPLATNLLCHTFLDHQNTPLFSKKFFYDNRGNVTEERLYGNLSGQSKVALAVSTNGVPHDNGVETYTIKRSYSQDSLNLLIREEEQNGKITLNNYHPNTSLITSKFICDHNTLKMRYFYEYNEDFLLVREIIDNGSSPDKHNLSDVSTRLIKELELVPNGQPYQGMPQIITEKYWDGSTEKLLKKTILTYTTGGCVETQDIYDSHNTHCYTLTAKYDKASRVLEETNPLGQTSIFQYDAVGNQIFYKDSSGQKETHKDYDFSNRLIKATGQGTDGLTFTTTHQYNTKNDRIETCDHYGQTTHFEHDNFGLIVKTHYPSRTTPNGHLSSPTEAQSYDASGRKTLFINARGYETRQKFNARNQVISIEHPDNGIEHFVYNLEGTLSSYTNQEQQTTRYTYDYLGRVTSETNPLGYTTTYLYDAFNLISIQDPENHITTYTYDGAGRKISEELDSEIITYSYDHLGRLSCIQKEDALHITTYDALDRIIEERDEDNDHHIYKKISYAYDEAGNRSCMTRYIQGQEAHETYLYDSFNRIIQHKDALGYATTTYYDDHYQNEQGQRVLKTMTSDPLGLTTLTTYDSAGQVAILEKAILPHKSLDLETYFYDETGNLSLHLKNHHQITSWTYDPMNRIQVLTEGKDKKTYYTYTKTGLLSKKKKPDDTLLTYNYDPLGLLTDTSSSDLSINYSFIYNRKGELIEEKNNNDGTYSLRKLDPHGRPTTEKLANGLCVSSDYDEQGRKNRLILPDHSEVLFQYDALFLRKIHRHEKTHEFNEHDLNGHLTKQTFMGSLGPMHFSYDLNGRRESCSSSFTTQKATFDPVGNLSRLSLNSEVKTYEYDELYRLIQEPRYTYDYDPNGNRLFKNQEEFHYSSLNELSSHQKCDPNGNPRTYNHATYTYDAFDRLTSIQTPTQSITFRYDYQGRLLSQTKNDNTLFFLYDGMKDIGTFDASGNALSLRILNPTYHSERGAAVLLEIKNTAYIPIHDLFGNITALLDLHGRPIETYHYTAFGEELKEGLNPWVYASKRSIFADTPLVFFGKRFYTPQYGRWLTPDPAGFVDEYNLYSFVSNNPLTNFDSYGLFTLPISLPPIMVDTKEAENYAVPITHALGDTLIDTGQFLSQTGFILSSPVHFLMNGCNWNKIEQDWNALNNTCSYLHEKLDIGLQSFTPLEEKSSSYHFLHSATQATLDGYLLAKAAGIGLEKAINSISPIFRKSSQKSFKSIARAERSGTLNSNQPQIANLSAMPLKNSNGFLGHKGFELKHTIYQTLRNDPTTVRNISYSGHALDQMQNRGLVPSVIEHTREIGQIFQTKGGTVGYYDSINNVRIIMNSKTGQVVTVIPGAPK